METRAGSEDQAQWKALGDLELRGAGGEPIDWRRSLASHGVAALPPNRIDTGIWTLGTSLPDAKGMSHSLLLREGSPGIVSVLVDSEVGAREARRLISTCRQMLRLDDDLSQFYALAARDPELAWVTSGGGRMLRSPTVFEDVVKTICTTNCAWSATERMVEALVQQLGTPDALGNHSFPSAQAMAGADPEIYRDVVRAGYRGAYLQSLARAVSEGDLDLEALNDPDLPDAEAEAALLALPGVGPYATAHIMLTALGRYGLLILDSWTRPTYARLSGRRASDPAIRRRFRKFGTYQGLAFWLYLTRSWVSE